MTFGKMAQPITVERHHARLRAGEKRRKQDEDNERPEQDTQGNFAQKQIKPARTP
jgi:hypothetical protein